MFSQENIIDNLKIEKSNVKKELIEDLSKTAQVTSDQCKRLILENEKLKNQLSK